MTRDSNAHEKRDRLRAMLDQGLVMIHLDPRLPGVVVPAGFRGQPVLRLNLAWGFNLPALDIGDDGVYAILSFNRQNVACTLPWPSVFAMTWPDQDHEGAIWEDDVPRELRSTMGEPPPRPRPVVALPTPAPASKPEVAPVPSDDEPRLPPLFIVHEGGRGKRPLTAPGPTEDAPAATDAVTEAPPARPRLRLVKG